ncbi:Co2+/Mg2+ efflux protein ApaG [Agarilytica rhodophyticola]|uniref:Co2+/Mg2+ efflux protein ApaG n=1 Tax=Agarilytica rhodophyticola TaxID=1737490 RepID=UPI001FE79E6A|nr:Co2+/Mg2+ efflux protein ApaG [Agarilytica rhodophyticola]
MLTNNVQVDVKTEYISEQSNPESNKFVYAYTINLTNLGDTTAQLISRHWFITDANENTQEVQGLGVVGEQPTLSPGESYTYTSGVVMETKTGMMTGTYTMETPSGESFEAQIPAFALVQEDALH